MTNPLVFFFSISEADQNSSLSLYLQYSDTDLHMSQQWPLTHFRLITSLPSNHHHVLVFLNALKKFPPVPFPMTESKTTLKEEHEKLF